MVVLVVWSVLAGCGSAVSVPSTAVVSTESVGLVGGIPSSTMDSSSTLAPLTFDEPLPADPGPDQGGAALQQSIFEDGVVTFAEYERAFVAALACMVTAGLEVEGPLRYPDGVLVLEPGTDPRNRLTMFITVPDDPSVDDSGITDSCQAQWSYAVETLWLRSVGPSQVEIQAWLEAAWACGEAAGQELSSPPTDMDAFDAVDTYGCKPWEALP